MWSAWGGLLQTFEHRESIRAHIISMGNLAPFAYCNYRHFKDVISSPIPGGGNVFYRGFSVWEVGRFF